MSSYAVVFTPEAEQHLAKLYRYISEKSSVDVALRFTMSIIDYCATMDEFPHRGIRRDDIRQGLRIVHFRQKTVLAVAIDDVAHIVTIVGVFYGGRNYEAILDRDDDDKA
jgi:toxin ParE1/3/4